MNLKKNGKTLENNFFQFHEHLSSRIFLSLQIMNLDSMSFDELHTLAQRYFMLVNQVITRIEQKSRELTVLPYKRYKKIITVCKYWKGTYNEDKCPVCLCNFKNGKTIHHTPCGHIFHPMCLRRAVCSHGPAKCPMCRQEIRETT